MNSCGSLTYRKRNYPVALQFFCCALFLLFFSSTVSAQVDEHIEESRVSEHQKTGYRIEYISFTGNKRTKQSIMLRELSFKAGDTLTVHEMESALLRSQQNLNNTSLFNFVTITYVLNEELKSMQVKIDVKERWYVWPSPIFEVQDRNFNSWWATKDLFRINYGLFLDFQNVRGRNESLILKFRKGYTELYGFNYRIPYIDKRQALGLSFGYNFYRNNEIAYATYGNQLLFYRNYRAYVRNEHEAKIGATYRDGLYMKHSFELMYKNCSVADSIRKLNASYFGAQSNIAYLSWQYGFRRDYRDSKVYPLRGYCFDATIVKDGLNLLKNENIDNFTVSANIKNYWSVLPRTFVSTGLKLRYMINNTPSYYFNRALGFNDFVRGYEYYVVDGQSFGMIKATVKYQLVKPHIANIPVKRLDKFNRVPYTVYLTMYGDGAYVQDKYYYNDNPLSNSFIMGCGVGIDLVTYYDYVVRIEASMNKMFQKGLYLHFAAPI
jgi:outer membrane protein assembly factor BamA